MNAAKKTERSQFKIPASSQPATAPAATAKARALAAARGVDLAQVTATGASIKETDVARHLAAPDSPRDPVAHNPRLVLAGDASELLNLASEATMSVSFNVQPRYTTIR